MSLKDELIKIGNNNPHLRDDVRPVLQHVVRESRHKRASIDAVGLYKSDVKQALDMIRESATDTIKQCQKALAPFDIKVNDKWEGPDRGSVVDYTYRSSGDGLMVAIRLIIVDQARQPRGREELNDIVLNETGLHVSRRNQPPEPRMWSATGGWQSKVFGNSLEYA